MHPYTSGVGAKAGPNRALRFEHFQVTPDYVADVSMHPYTSGVGVAPEGGRNRPGDLQGVKRQNDKALPGPAVNGGHYDRLASLTAVIGEARGSRLGRHRLAEHRTQSPIVRPAALA